MQAIIANCVRQMRDRKDIRRLASYAFWSASSHGLGSSPSSRLNLVAGVTPDVPSVRGCWPCIQSRSVMAGALSVLIGGVGGGCTYDAMYDPKGTKFAMPVQTMADS